jgi:hypothetical protein
MSFSLSSCDPFFFGPADHKLEAEIRVWLAGLLGDVRFGDKSVGIWELLRDGVAMCQMANKLWPGAVPKVNTGTALAFKQMENIANYIRLCGSRLAVPASCLFQTTDLFEGKDMNMVLINIRYVRQLSEKGIALAALPSMLTSGAATATTGLLLSSSSSSSLASPTHSKLLTRSPGGSPASPSMSPSSPMSILDSGHRPSKSEVLQVSHSRSSSQRVSFGASALLPAPDVTSSTDDIKIKEELKYNSELEQAVKDWICAVMGDASLFATGTFLAVLKSGVVLCKLINKLRADLISRISTSGVAYAQMENISSYLRACLGLGLT